MIGGADEFNNKGKTMSNTALSTLTQSLSEKLGLGSDGSSLIDTLKQTAFKTKDNAPVSDAQMTALLVIANQYGLNPWTKEIYAYPDKGSIVPVVGVDGWSRIINNNDKLDGVSFTYSDETITHKGRTAHVWIECSISRNDRKNPTVVREYFDEVKREANFTTPWDTHPKRMHRHKALIQCARIAFGFGGIYDQDEAERILEKNMGKAETVKPDSQPYSQDDFNKNIEKWTLAIESEKITADDLIAKIETKGKLSDEQLKTLREIKSKVIDADGVIENAQPVEYDEDNPFN